MVCWITGASSGIGAALAQRMSREGARVVLSARREEALEAVRAACERPEEHLVLPLDLAAPETFGPAVERVLQRYGRVDVLVNNGGVGQRSLAPETSLEVDRRIMEVNFFGAVGLTKAVLPAMLERGAGRIVVVSSVLGKVATARRSAYAASKHALHGYFDALRAEVSPRGVGVTIVCPGYVRTDISVHALRADGGEHGRMDDVQRNGIPPARCADAIARAVAAGRDEVYVGGKEIYGIYLRRLLPAGVFNRLVRRFG